jgi:hypothetical protein
MALINIVKVISFATKSDLVKNGLVLDYDGDFAL